MNFWRRSTSAVLGRFAPEQRIVYGIQFLLLFAISTLLYLGVPSTLEWRQFLTQGRPLHTIIGDWDSLTWYVWVVAAPAMLWLVRSSPLTRGCFRGSLLRLLLGSMLLCLVVAHVRFLLRILSDAVWPSAEWVTNFDTYAYNTFAMLPLDILAGGGFIAVSFSVNSYFKHQQKTEEAAQLQLKTAQLQSDLARAELAALRGQLHPHFLFNSFNAVATLVRQQKNDAAVEIIAQLSGLLRMAIDRTGLQEVPLEQELDFIRRYLDIEHVRFGDKLIVEIAVEPAVLTALVPNIVLQPLVENAIKHGISLRTTPGRVRLLATHAGDRLHIEIVDDGPDQPAAQPFTGHKEPGIGLPNVRAQLGRLYGADYRLEIQKRPEGGTIVTLELPWRCTLTPQIP